MKKRNGGQLVKDFVHLLNNRPEFNVTNASISRNVFKVSGNIEFLLYVKGRSGDPHKWGVTKNVVERLESQTLPWFVILLFDSSETGFILTYGDVRNYIRNIWPLGADGDYKPATGTYLSNNSPFYSIDF